MPLKHGFKHPLTALFGGIIIILLFILNRDFGMEGNVISQSGLSENLELMNLKPLPSTSPHKNLKPIHPMTTGTLSPDAVRAREDRATNFIEFGLETSNCPSSEWLQAMRDVDIAAGQPVILNIGCNKVSTFM